MLVSKDGLVADLPEHLETPCVLVDEDALHRNIRLVQSIADASGCVLRPHVKTHKSLDLAAIQLQEGAVGITAAKSEEAAAFIRAGIASVTVAYPIVDPRKLDRLIAAAQDKGTDLRLIVDHPDALQALEQAAARRAFALGVFLKVDVGLGRVGVKSDDRLAVELPLAIARSRFLRFCGLLAHAGHAYAASDPAEVARIAEAERRLLLDLKERLTREGVEVPEVSVGSTPTVLAAEQFDGITELRPGNYVFLDHTAVRMGLCAVDRVALGVLTTVVSAGATKLIVDAGSKVLSSDLGPHGSSGDGGFGRAFACGRANGSGLAVRKLSEEHGFVEPLAGAKVGDRVLIVPNHACAVTNLVGRMTLLRAGRETVEWPLHAQSMVR